MLPALLALARSTDGDATVPAELLGALERLDFAKLSADEQCWDLRILTVSAIRHGMFSKEAAAKIVARIEPQLPSTNPMDPGGTETHFSPRPLASTAPSPVSFLPPGLLNTLTEADLLDLLAYLLQPAAEGVSASRAARCLRPPVG